MTASPGRGTGKEKIMGTLIVGGLLAAAVGAAVRSMVRDRKNGKSIHCGGDCSRCRGNCV